VRVLTSKQNSHVDNTKELTHISLCAGYGGIDLGLKRVITTLRTVAFCEIEAFAVANLVAKMEAGLLDAAPIWTNLKTFPWSDFRDRVDILSGGYPCQPFSNAGQRRGAEDERHLWPYIADGIRLLRPRLCIFENVEGHITLGLSSVVSDLEQLGYKVSWGLFSASEVGAPHQRKRVFIMAVSRGIGGQAGLPRPVAWDEGIAGIAHHGCAQDAWPSRPGEPQHAWEPPRVVANSTSERTNRRSELCGEERGQGRALQRESDATGDSHELADTRRDPSERRDAVGRVLSGDGEAQGRGEAGGCGGEDVAREREESQPVRSGAEPAMGDTSGEGCKGSRGSDDSEWATHGFAVTNGSGTDRSMESEQRQVEPEVDGSTHGTANWVGYAELCISCDNCTDELRLLGNGVVPATAARAFEVLMQE
jgi:DNA (cytosine-5)-methyltransferase 1